MVQNFRVEYSTNNGSTWTAFTNVQSVSAQVGRKTLKDPFTPSSMTFSMRYPDGYYTPNAALVTGTLVRVYRANSSNVMLGYEMWRGFISNVSVDWGIPYNTVTHQGAADYATVSCEGAMAQWGRLQGNDLAVSNTNAYYALAEVAFASSLPVGTTYFPTDTTLVAASTVNNTYLEWVNLLATTLGSTVKDGSGQLGVYTKDFVGSLPVSFSDTANNATNQVYEQVQLTSQVENYFTQILINTSAYGQQSATYGSPPYRTLELSTISGSAAQGNDVANYYLGLYKIPNIGISSITCRSESQASWALDLGYAWYDILGYRTYLTFRAVTYYMTIIGASFQATPSGSTFTYDLADASLNPWFILDSSVYGILDTNKLSW